MFVKYILGRNGLFNIISSQYDFIEASSSTAILKRDGFFNGQKHNIIHHQVDFVYSLLTDSITQKQLDSMRKVHGKNKVNEIHFDVIVTCIQTHLYKYVWWLPFGLSFKLITGVEKMLTDLKPYVVLSHR